MDDLQLAVAKLRALSPKLNGAIDQAQRVVVQIENFLANECEVAIQADVPVIYNDKGVAVTLLRYGRVDGKFRIALTATDGDARFVSRAWTECDRNEKLATFGALPKLVLAITKAVETQINATTQTTKTVGALMAALGIEALADSADSADIEGEPRLAIMMKSEDALEAQGASRPVARTKAVVKITPGGNSEPRRSNRKEEAKAS